MKLPVSLEAGGQLNFPLHEIGRNLVGTVEFVPEGSFASKIDSIRYLYKGRGAEESFESALLIPSLVGSGESLTAPFTTLKQSAILEVANTLNEEVVVQFEAHGKLQGSIPSQRILLGAKASQHIILDSLLPSDEGIVVIKGEKAESIVAVLMQYARRDDGSVSFVYGILARQALGSILQRFL